MQPVYKTRGELLDILLDRLGFGGVGAAAGNFVPYAGDLLVEAQEQMFEALPNRLRRRFFTFNTGVGQVWYDIPTSCDVDRIEKFEVQVNELWIPVRYGITSAHDDDAETQSYPVRYQFEFNTSTSRTQIRVSPEPDDIYPMRIFSEITLGDFAANNDYCSIDYRLILLYAIAYGKAHLGRRDAQTAMDALTFRLRQLKGNQHQGKRYIRGRGHEQDPTPKPKVV